MADPDFRVVAKHGLAHYQSVLDKMSPELREAFLNASLWAGLSEGDSIYAVLALVAELLSKATDKQTELITSALEAALSATRAENKRLAVLLDACKVALREAAETVTHQSAISAEQIESLKATLRDELRQHRDATERQIAELRQEVARNADAGSKFQRQADRLSEMTENRVAWGLALAFLSGILACALVPWIVHWLFHL